MPGGEMTARPSKVDMRLISKRLGRRLRGLRKSRNLTQEDLSELAGIHYTFLGHIERGNKSPSLETLSRLAKVLKLRISSLVESID